MKGYQSPDLDGLYLGILKERDDGLSESLYLRNVDKLGKLQRSGRKQVLTLFNNGEKATPGNLSRPQRDLLVSKQFNYLIYFKAI